jgi:predicted nucleotidyltransferase
VSEDRLATRKSEVERLIGAVRDWSGGRGDIRAVALVGSWARGNPEADSDVDLVLLARDPAVYVEADGWVAELGAVEVVATHDRGVVVEHRLLLPKGLEVDVAIGDPGWAATAPPDEGTVRVASAGMIALHDPDGLLARLADALLDLP